MICFLVLLIHNIWCTLYLKNPIRDQILESEEFELIIPEDLFENTGDSRTLVSSSTNSWTKVSYVEPRLESPTCPFLYANEIGFSGNFALVQSQGHSLWIFDFSGTLPISLGEFVLGDGIYTDHIYVEEKYLYYSRKSGVAIFDITNKTHPLEVGVVPVSCNHVTGVFVQDDVLYVIFDKTLCSFALQIFNITNKTGSVNLGQLYRFYLTDVNIIEGLFVKGDYAYIYESNNLRIVNVSNTSVTNDPTLISTYNVSDKILDVFVTENDFAFVLVSLRGLEIVDVSNKVNPRLVSVTESLDVKYGSVIVENDLAYVTFSPGYPSVLNILNISDPTNPLLLGSVETKVSTSQLRTKGDYVILAEYEAGLVIVDKSDLTDPKLVKNLYPSGDVRAIHVEGRYVYASLATSSNYDSHGLVIIDSSNYPVDTCDSIVGSIYGTNSEGFIKDFRVVGDYIYAISDVSLSAIAIIDAQSDKRVNLQLLGTYEWVEDGWTLSIVVNEKNGGIFAYVAFYKNGISRRRSGGERRKPRSTYLKVFNVSDHTANPVFIGQSKRFPGVAYHLTCSEDQRYLFMVIRTAVHIFDTDSMNQTQPEPISSFDLHQGESVLEVRGNYVYVANDVDGLKIFDVSDILHPEEIITYHLPDKASNLIVEGDCNMVTVLSYYSESLMMIDISDIDSPVLVDHFYNNIDDEYRMGKPFCVSSQDNFLFIGSSEGLKIFQRSLKISGSEDFHNFCGESRVDVSAVDIIDDEITVWDSFVLSRPSYCQNFGICLPSESETAPQRCLCSHGFEGDKCETWKCTSVDYKNVRKTCNGHGNCISPNVCECHETWMGEECDRSVFTVALLYPFIGVLSVSSVLCLFAICGVIYTLCCVGLSFSIFCICCCTYSVTKQMRGLKRYAELENFDLLLEEQKLDLDTSIAHIRIDKTLFHVDMDEIKTENILGEGGSSSIVFRTLWRGRQVAFKCFKTRALMSSQDVFDEFEREVSILSSISHPNIIQFFGACLKPPRVGILMEFCPNGECHDFVIEFREKHGHGYPILQKLRLLTECTSAVEYLHGKSIIHRDLKCENVLISEDNQAKLMDFGLSRIVEKGVQKTNRIGTSIYMSPEIVTGVNYDDKCDVFSLAIMIWIILTEDKCPYKLHKYDVELKVANDPTLRPDLSKIEYLSEEYDWIKEMLAVCWDHNPEKRYSCKVMREMLEEKGYQSSEVAEDRRKESSGDPTQTVTKDYKISSSHDDQGSGEILTICTAEETKEESLRKLLLEQEKENYQLNLENVRINDEIRDFEEKIEKVKAVLQQDQHPKKTVLFLKDSEKE